MERCFLSMNSRRLFFALLMGVLFLPGCRHPPGFTSDQTLKNRLTRNRADFDELIRLYQSRTEDNVSVDAITDGSPSSKKIQEMLLKLNATGIGRSTDEIHVVVQNSLGWHYWFEYRTTAPHGLVPSLEEKTRPNAPRAIYYIHLEDNWYACVMEDE
jgi:hypothetical protein